MIPITKSKNFTYVPSETRKGKVYRVSMNRNKGTLQCNCLDHLMRNRICKHINKVIVAGRGEKNA